MACEAGTYKSALGAGLCLTCPSNTISWEGSNALADCACVPGYPEL